MSCERFSRTNANSNGDRGSPYINLQMLANYLVASPSTSKENKGFIILHIFSEMKALLNPNKARVICNAFQSTKSNALVKYRLIHDLATSLSIKIHGLFLP